MVVVVVVVSKPFSIAFDQWKELFERPMYYEQLPGAGALDMASVQIQLFPVDLGGSAHILEKVQPNSTIRHGAQLNGNSVSISSYEKLDFVTTQAISTRFHSI